MHSHRLQRLLTGMMLSLIWALFYIGEPTIAFGLLAFVIAMIFIWAVFDFCPSLWFFKKVLKEESAKACS
ncbi:MAG: phosphoribosylaminoimidazole synthetase [Sulfurimonadaceae bacterium]